MYCERCNWTLNFDPCVSVCMVSFRSSDSSDKGGHGGGAWGGRRRDDSKPGWKREDKRDQRGMHECGGAGCSVCVSWLTLVSL